MTCATLSASLVLVLSASSSFAQARGQAPATTPAPAPARGAQAPAAPAQPVPPPAPPAPFPVGAKIAFVNLQQIASESVDGKASAARVQKTMADKQTGVANRAKALQAKQQQLSTGGNLMNDAAREQLTKDITNQDRDNQRFEQDSQAELQELQQQLQDALLKKLFPVLEQLRKDKDLWVIFSQADAGMLAGDAGLDLTAEAVKRMDAAK
jgi:Skp family chaperone for outer membrane proteins